MKKIILVLFVFVGLLVGATAKTMERFPVLTTLEMQQLMEKRQAGTFDFVLVNTLDEIIYRHASIPGSVNVPWSKVDRYADRLGDDRQKLIITYCMGYR